jgi:hypothetical protein
MMAAGGCVVEPLLYHRDQLAVDPLPTEHMAQRLGEVQHGGHWQGAWSKRVDERLGCARQGLE